MSYSHLTMVTSHQDKQYKKTWLLTNLVEVSVIRDLVLPPMKLTVFDKEAFKLLHYKRNHGLNNLETTIKIIGEGSHYSMLTVPEVHDTFDEFSAKWKALQNLVDECFKEFIEVKQIPQ